MDFSNLPNNKLIVFWSILRLWPFANVDYQWKWWWVLR